MEADDAGGARVGEWAKVIECLFLCSSSSDDDDPVLVAVRKMNQGLPVPSKTSKARIQIKQLMYLAFSQFIII